MRAVRDELIHDFLDDELISYYLTLIHDTKNHLQIKHYKKNMMTQSHLYSSLLIHQCKRTLKRMQKKKERTP
jgi:hypothetical protein